MDKGATDTGQHPWETEPGASVPSEEQVAGRSTQVSAPARQLLGPSPRAPTRPCRQTPPVPCMACRLVPPSTSLETWCKRPRLAAHSLFHLFHFHLSFTFKSQFPSGPPPMSFIHADHVQMQTPRAASWPSCFLVLEPRHSTYDAPHQKIIFFFQCRDSTQGSALPLGHMQASPS